MAYDLDGNLIGGKKKGKEKEGEGGIGPGPYVYAQNDALHMRPYRCSIIPRSDGAKRLIEGTMDVVGY